jgi:hypothetical protein
MDDKLKNKIKNKRKIVTIFKNCNKNKNKKSQITG